MSKKHFLRGLRDGIPIGLGYFAVSFGIGISCHAAGITALQGFLMSLFNNASAGEYGGITVITENAGVWMMVLMTLIINARYMLMSCALSQKLSPDTPLGVRMLIGFDVIDEVFGIAIAQEGILNIWYFVGAMCAAIPGWSLGTLFGALAGNVLPVWAMNGFSVMLYGMFLAIIMPEGKKNRVVLGCIGVSFVLSALAAKLLPMLSGGMRILLLTIFISAAAVSLPLAMAALMVCRSRSWRNSESDGSMMEGLITSSVRFPSQVAVTFSLPPAPSVATVWEASFSWAAASPACICWTCFIIFIMFMAVVFGSMG